MNLFDSAAQGRAPAEPRPQPLGHRRRQLPVRVNHLDRRCCDIQQIEFLGQRFYDHPDIIQPTFKQALAKRSPRQLQPSRTQVGYSRQRGKLDFLFGESLKVAEQAVLARLHESDRHSRTAKPAGSTIRCT